MRAVEGLDNGYWAGLCRRIGAVKMAHTKVSPLGVALSAIGRLNVPAICERLGVVRGVLIGRRRAPVMPAAVHSAPLPHWPISIGRDIG
jgi:hypothetical protein